MTGDLCHIGNLLFMPWVYLLCEICSLEIKCVVFMSYAIYHWGLCHIGNLLFICLEFISHAKLALSRYMCGDGALSYTEFTENLLILIKRDVYNEYFVP